MDKFNVLSRSHDILAIQLKSAIASWFVDHGASAWGRFSCAVLIGHQSADRPLHQARTAVWSAELPDRSAE